MPRKRPRPFIPLWRGVLFAAAGVKVRYLVGKVPKEVLKTQVRCVIMIIVKGVEHLCQSCLER